ncbi:MAG: helix-turn-helix domain-containing protein [Okeania sp. SIO3C4]|nr:helix-turn-helix domain-containing protein [Okeania sp. SIO3C4]
MDAKDSGLDWRFNPLKIFRREILPLLADLRLAIALLLVIAISSISGTVIEQGESINFYQENYPEKPALFGFLTWKVILLLELDHVYRTWWFLSILILFGASLTACTFTRQMPALKSANRWKFYNKKQQFENLALSTEIEKASLDSLEKILQHEHLNFVRLEQAKHLLRNYGMTIKEVAANCGFADSNYFCRLFRQKTDRTPSQYRMQYHSKAKYDPPRSPPV